jgi:hypothetical protein
VILARFARSVPLLPPYKKVLMTKVKVFSLFVLLLKLLCVPCKPETQIETAIIGWWRGMLTVYVLESRSNLHPYLYDMFPPLHLWDSSLVLRRLRGIRYTNPSTIPTHCRACQTIPKGSL